MTCFKMLRIAFGQRQPLVSAAMIMVAIVLSKRQNLPLFRAHIFMERRSSREINIAQLVLRTRYFFLASSLFRNRKRQIYACPNILLNCTNHQEISISYWVFIFLGTTFLLEIIHPSIHLVIKMMIRKFLNDWYTSICVIKGLNRSKCEYKGV